MNDNDTDKTTTPQAHTPGPWRWVPGKGHREGSIEPKICDFGDSTQYYSTAGMPPSEADACLIAAAPDMLEALKDAVDLFEGANVYADFLTSIQVIMKARAAIAKAEGRE